MSARKRLYDHIRRNGIGAYLGEELRSVGEVSEWARYLRQLKQDSVIDYDYDRGQNNYNITAIKDYKTSTKRTGLTSKAKYRIRNRDGHRCQSCGKGPNDKVKLVVDHKVPVDCGGSHKDENLWTLCQDCNGGKQAFFKDEFEPEVMRLVFDQNSGYQRLKVLFENSPGKKFAPAILQGIAGVRDWERSVRSIRAKHEINIEWVRPTKDDPDGYYINKE